MKTTKIVIKNLFGIKETELDGRSVEISGPKGSGKTSVLDSIRYALTNRSDRDYIVHRGADEGEILIETDTGLSIDRKALPAKSAGTVKVRDGSLLQTRPAEFLSQIFTPLQLNPVEFTQLSRQEKNRVILNLIEFAWDTNWIREQFGEIPQGVDYSKHILEVLHDIQAENGVYFQSRQNINRDIRNKQAFVSDIAKDIPSGYDFDHWNTYPIGEKYRELESLKEQNNVIERARAFRNSHEAKLRGLEGQRDLDIAAIDRKMRDGFLEAFDTVNKKFGEMFGLLFPGGQGHLEMTDPEDPSSTGIEVVAQPRGKRVTKMSLLSGGERSLTALGLLFAVYKTRSVPFYVLDEVEAALDDSNLDRLLGAIERLRANTQLIVISHQRRTMEAADVLYGVSMKSDGVSQVISQKLERK